RGLRSRAGRCCRRDRRDCCRGRVPRARARRERAGGRRDAPRAVGDAARRGRRGPADGAGRAGARVPRVARRARTAGGGGVTSRAGDAQRSTASLRHRLAERGIDPTLLLLVPGLVVAVALFVYPFSYGIGLTVQPTAA